MKTDCWQAALVATSLALASTAGAQMTLPVNKCLAQKLSAISKNFSGRASCVSKEVRSGTESSDCPQKPSDKFTGGGDPTKGAFNKLEAKYPPAGTAPCLTFGDQADFDNAIATSVAAIVAITGVGPSKCDAAKITCAAKYVVAVLKCHAKAAGKSGSVDSQCLDKAISKLADGSNGCLAKAASLTDCTHPGSQAAALQGVADDFDQAAVFGVDPNNPTSLLGQQIRKRVTNPSRKTVVNGEEWAVAC